MSHLRRVLIVDRWFESRDVLSTLLERSGAEVVEAAGSRDAAGLATARQPDVIVYDADNNDDALDRSDLATAAVRICAPVVVVGTVKRGASPLPTDRFVSKPYHYRLLLRRIEGCVRG